MLYAQNDRIECSGKICGNFMCSTIKYFAFKNHKNPSFLSHIKKPIEMLWNSLQIQKFVSIKLQKV